MITIQSGKLIIPEEDRLVGFAGDNLTNSKEFKLLGHAGAGAEYTLCLRFDDDTVRTARLTGVADGEDLVLTWNIKSEHLSKPGIVMAQLKAVDGDGGISHTSCDYFIVASSAEFADDGSELEYIIRSEFEERMNAAVATARATAPYIGDDGCWYVYNSDREVYECTGISASGVTVDDAVSPSSTNPVENRAVKAYVDTADADKVDKTTKIAGLELSGDIGRAALGERLTQAINPPYVVDGTTDGQLGQFGRTTQGTPVMCNGIKRWSALALSDEVPTKTSDLTNDSGFLTAHDVPQIIALSPVGTPPASGDNDYVPGRTYCYQTGSAKIWVLCGRTTLSESEHAYGYQWVQIARVSDLPDISGKVDKSMTIAGVDLQDDITSAELKTALNVRDGLSAYQIAVNNGFIGTEEEWLASLNAPDPIVLPLSVYPTEVKAVEYMDAQQDTSRVYVWNNKLFCYSVHTEEQLTGACAYGCRNSASSGIVFESGKSLFILPVSNFSAPLTIDFSPFELSATPYFYGGTSPTVLNKTLIANDGYVRRTDPVTITEAQLQGCSYIAFAVTTVSEPSNVSVTVNGTAVPLNVVASPDEIPGAIGSDSVEVGGYIDSGVIYTALIDENSREKYISDRGVYLLPVPTGFCESKATYEAGSHYLSKYPYATMTAMFSALASAHPDYITETSLGRDASGTYDIKSYVLDAPSSLSAGQASVVSTSKPTVIITAGLHGVEPDAVHTVYHMVDDLCDHYMESEMLFYLHNNIRFIILPICNPWGYVNRSYHNSNDVDLNKNFEYGYRNNGSANTGSAAYSEAETQLMKEVFDTYSDALLHIECHGKYGVDTAYGQTIWFSLMKTLGSELIELAANDTAGRIGMRLKGLGYETNDSTGGYITYYGLNGRPKDYTGTKYGMLSLTMEGTGCIYSETGYSVNTQKINCEALENFIRSILAGLNGGCLKV